MNATSSNSIALFYSLILTLLIAVSYNVANCEIRGQLPNTRGLLRRPRGRGDNLAAFTNDIDNPLRLHQRAFRDVVQSVRGSVPMPPNPDRKNATQNERDSFADPWDENEMNKDDPLFEIHNGDDRSSYLPTSAPFIGAASIGVVLTHQEECSCTGTMIGKRLFVTAFHCLDFDAYGNLGYVKFMPAYYDGGTPYGQYYASYCWWAFDNINEFDSDGDGLLTTFDNAFDYVVCGLDVDVDSRVEGFDVYTYDTSWNGGDYWYHAGYPARSCGLTDLKPVYSDYEIIDDVEASSVTLGTGYALLHKADTQVGHSGGPIFAYWDSIPGLIGIQSSGSSTTNVAGGGPALAKLLETARSAGYY